MFWTPSHFSFRCALTPATRSGQQSRWPTLTELRRLVCLPIHHLPYLLYITVTPPPSPCCPPASLFPCSKDLRKKLIKKKSKLVLSFFLCRQLPSWNSWNYFLEAAPVESPAARTERNSFPSFGKEWSSLRSHRRKSSASPFGSQTVKVAAHLQTPTCTFFFFFSCSVHARSALSLVLCRAALRLLSHPLLLPGRTSSQSGAVTHFCDSDCLDETTVVLPPPRLRGVAAAAPACARPVNYQQQRRHCRWSHRSPRLFLSPPQLRH